MSLTKDKLNVVIVLLYDEQKRLLLQHRSMDTPRMPGYWAFFGGSIDEGETPIEAIRREAYEELQCTLKDPKCIFEQDFELDVAAGHMRVYVDAYFEDKHALVLQEGQGWGWYTQEEIKNLKMIEHDRRVIEEVVLYIDMEGQKGNYEQ